MPALRRSEVRIPSAPPGSPGVATRFRSPQNSTIFPGLRRQRTVCPIYSAVSATSRSSPLSLMPAASRGRRPSRNAYALLDYDPGDFGSVASIAANASAVIEIVTIRPSL